LSGKKPFIQPIFFLSSLQRDFSAFGLEMTWRMKQLLSTKIYLGRLENLQSLPNSVGPD
jgi:hypothetical protein